MAHIGAVEALLEAGVVVDRIAGTSMGALVAAAFAVHGDGQAVRDRFHAGFIETNPSNDYVPPAYSIIRGARPGACWRPPSATAGSRSWPCASSA